MCVVLACLRWRICWFVRCVVRVCFPVVVLCGSAVFGLSFCVDVSRVARVILLCVVCECCFVFVCLCCAFACWFVC